MKTKKEILEEVKNIRESYQNGTMTKYMHDSWILSLYTQLKAVTA